MIATNCFYEHAETVIITVDIVVRVLVGVGHALHEAKNVAEVVWQTRKGTWASAQR